jgi:hypothetical protein
VKLGITTLLPLIYYIENSVRCKALCLGYDFLLGRERKHGYLWRFVVYTFTERELSFWASLVQTESRIMFCIVQSPFGRSLWHCLTSSPPANRQQHGHIANPSCPHSVRRFDGPD